MTYVLIINLTSSRLDLCTTTPRFPSGLEVLHICTSGGGALMNQRASGVSEVLTCSHVSLVPFHVRTLPVSNDWPLSGSSVLLRWWQMSHKRARTHRHSCRVRRSRASHCVNRFPSLIFQQHPGNFPPQTAGLHGLMEKWLNFVICFPIWCRRWLVWILALHEASQFV